MTVSPHVPLRSVQILDDAIIDQIAAGEVVERPASVVKELVENALDAGATSISVVLENGGQGLIEVVDNGTGMSREDALLAIRRFGTSKIRTPEDLVAINTLGFRGEALPSIASVSKFELLSWTGQPGTQGILIRIDGGETKEIRDVAAPAGTRMTVSALFYNVPARRKFLKTAATEAAAVKALLADIAAAAPAVRLRLVADGVETMNIAGASGFEERVRELRYGGDDPLVLESEVTTPSGKYRLQGIVTKPRDAVAGANRLRLLVNGRSVRDRLFMRAIRDGYGDFLKGNRYPAGVVSLFVPADDLDVNVHPQKSEVRFRTPDAVFRTVHAAFRRALQSTDLASRPQESPFKRFYKDAAEAPREMSVPIQWSNVAPGTQEMEVGEISRREFERFSPGPGQAAPAASAFTSSSDRPNPAQSDRFRYIGQVFDCYLVFAEQEKTLIIDMHAAHERVTFARLKKQYLEGKSACQLLLVPEVVEVMPGEWPNLRELFPVLQALGFEVEEFGNQSAIVRAVPALLARMSAASALRDILSVEDRSVSSARVEEKVDAVIARLACHGSIRSGKQMLREEAFALLDQIQSVELAPFCPHGRPVMIELTKADFELFFGR